MAITLHHRVPNGLQDSRPRDEVAALSRAEQRRLEREHLASRGPDMDCDCRYCS